MYTAIVLAVRSDGPRSLTFEALSHDSQFSGSDHSGSATYRDLPGIGPVLAGAAGLWLGHRSAPWILEALCGCATGRIAGRTMFIAAIIPSRAWAPGVSVDRIKAWAAVVAPEVEVAVATAINELSDTEGGR